MKFALRKNDVIMTAKSSKVKIAIVDYQPEEDVILTGGMLCIRPKDDVILPSYLKMFLDSTKGKEILKSIQKGSVIQTITVSALKSILVSCPPLELQEYFAKRYQSKLSMYAALKKELADLEEKINNFYDDVEGSL